MQVAQAAGKEQAGERKQWRGENGFTGLLVKGYKCNKATSLGAWSRGTATGPRPLCGVQRVLGEPGLCGKTVKKAKRKAKLLSWL